MRQPDGSAHFVVAWSRGLGAVQVMDPAIGRHWESGARFLKRTFVHEHPVPAVDFRAWTETEEFLTVEGMELLAD